MTKHGRYHLWLLAVGAIVSLMLTVPLESFATITGGSVTGGSAKSNGGIFKLVSIPIPSPSGNCPPNSVGKDCQDTLDLWAFDEDQNIVLSSPLPVDDTDGDGSPDGQSLPAGSTVASHYVYFDPAGVHTLEGCVQFDSNIVATITTRENLTNSDFLANTGVNYLSPSLRGLEPIDSATFSGKQLCVDFRASSPGDYIRVLTEFSPGAVKEASVDIKPQSCPNPLNIDSKGVIPAAILGTANLNVTDINATSVKLEGVSPIRHAIEDVATPFEPFTGKQEKDDCTDEGPDGMDDLTLKFDRQKVVDALPDTVSDGDVITLNMTGRLIDSLGATPIAGEDVVFIIDKPAPSNQGNPNRP